MSPNVLAMCETAQTATAAIAYEPVLAVVIYSSSFHISFIEYSLPLIVIL